MSHSQKSATFRFNKTVKNVKIIIGSKTEKFAKSVTKLLENVGLQYKIFTYCSIRYSL